MAMLKFSVTILIVSPGVCEFVKRLLYGTWCGRYMKWQGQDRNRWGKLGLSDRYH